MKLGVLKLGNKPIKALALGGVVATASLGLTLQGALANTWSTYGNTTYGPSGTYSTYGNTTYGPAGTMSCYGNTCYGP